MRNHAWWFLPNAYTSFFDTVATEGEIWGYVNYHWKDCWKGAKEASVLEEQRKQAFGRDYGEDISEACYSNATGHYHVLWVKDGALYKSVVPLHTAMFSPNPALRNMTQLFIAA